MSSCCSLLHVLLTHGHDLQAVETLFHSMAAVIPGSTDAKAFFNCRGKGWNAFQCDTLSTPSSRQARPRSGILACWLWWSNHGRQALLHIPQGWLNVLFRTSTHTANGMKPQCCRYLRVHLKEWFVCAKVNHIILPFRTMGKFVFFKNLVLIQRNDAHVWDLWCFLVDDAGWCQDNGNRSNQESKFDFLATVQCLVKIEIGEGLGWCQLREKIDWQECHKFDCWLVQTIFIFCCVPSIFTRHL